jgi:ATP-dependent Lon protease
MVRGLKDIFELYSIENTRIGKEIVKQILNAKELQEMIDLIAINIPLSVEGKQILIETVEVVDRYEKLMVIIT